MYHIQNNCRKQRRPCVHLPVASNSLEDRICDLTGLLHGKAKRAGDGDITLFKSVGTALQVPPDPRPDLASIRHARRSISTPPRVALQPFIAFYFPPCLICLITGPS